jgi:hypothetical protein
VLYGFFSAFILAPIRISLFQFMSAPSNVSRRPWLTILLASTVAGATAQAAILATDAFPISPLLSILIAAFCTGKVAGALLMHARKPKGWWVWLGSSVAVALTWLAAALLEVRDVKHQMAQLPENQRTLGSGEALLGNSPVWGLLFWAVLIAIWAFLYRTQRKHFTA